jgi:hypothetical protein
MAIVSALLDRVLQDLEQQGVPFEAADLVQRMKQAASARQQEITRHKANLKTAIAAQHKLLKRFKRKSAGENRMAVLISGRIAFLEGQSGMMDRQTEAMRKAELFLAEYRFEPDQQAAAMSFVTF